MAFSHIDIIRASRALARKDDRHVLLFDNTVESVLVLESFVRGGVNFKIIMSPLLDAGTVDFARGFILGQIGLEADTIIEDFSPGSWNLVLATGRSHQKHHEHIGNLKRSGKIGSSLSFFESSFGWSRRIQLMFAKRVWKTFEFPNLFIEALRIRGDNFDRSRRYFVVRSCGSIAVAAGAFLLGPNLFQRQGELISIANAQCVVKCGVGACGGNPVCECGICTGGYTCPDFC